jgi:hypothetical protein
MYNFVCILLIRRLNSFFYLLVKSIVNQSISNFDDYALESIIDESEVIERDYHAYFDTTILNEDMNRCFSKYYLIFSLNETNHLKSSLFKFG